MDNTRSNNRLRADEGCRLRVLYILCKHILKFIHVTSTNTNDCKLKVVLINILSVTQASKSFLYFVSKNCWTDYCILDDYCLHTLYLFSLVVVCCSLYIIIITHYSLFVNTLFIIYLLFVCVIVFACVLLC